MKQRSTTREVLIALGGILIVAVLMLSLFLFQALRSEQEMMHDLELFSSAQLKAETMARAEVVIARIEAYRTVHQSYPTRLDLVVDADETDLMPTAGHPTWRYWAQRDGEDFGLSFGAGRDHYPCKYYTSEDESWHMDQ